MQKYHTHTLPNGLRIIHLPSASPVVYCGYQIAAGTRHEAPGEEGMAHFCEHITFKGTQRRNALQIINALERVGGELNAFTNKEDTTYYAAIHRDHFSRAADLLTDIVFNSQYPQAEIDKEVDVICDEIESYNDTPAELIFDEFENIIFEGHPLGHNILGKAEQLRTYTTADALRFVHRHYRPDNAVFFVYGDIEFQKVIKNLSPSPSPKERGVYSSAANSSVGNSSAGNSSVGNSSAGNISVGNSSVGNSSAGNSSAGNSSVGNSSVGNSSADKCNHSPLLGRGVGGEVITRHLQTHQAHVMMGCRAYDIHHPRRIALYLLNNLLGGPGMSSRLNLSLRERHGLVYTVESTMVCYGDTGLWAVYFGCDPTDVNKCCRLVRRQLDRLMQRPLGKTQLAAAKQQLKGQIAIACDNREQFALDFGKSFLHYGWEKSVDELLRQIDAVSADDLQQVACELFGADRLTTLIFN